MLAMRVLDFELPALRRAESILGGCGPPQPRIEGTSARGVLLLCQARQRTDLAFGPLAHCAQAVFMAVEIVWPVMDATALDKRGDQGGILASFSLPCPAEAYPVWCDAGNTGIGSFPRV